MRRIALIGHSHAVAILDAIADWRGGLGMDRVGTEAGYTESFRGWSSINTGGRMIRLSPYPGFEVFEGLQVCLINAATFRNNLAEVKEVVNGQVRFEVSPLLGGFIESIQGFDAVISVIQGNEHTLLSLVATLPDYDFAPFDDPPCGQPLDRVYIDSWLSQMCMPVAAPLACMRGALRTTRILHVPPPPPLFDPSRTSTLEVLAEQIKQHGFTRPQLRRKWYETYVSRLEARLHAMGVAMIGPDLAEIGEAGFLRPEFSEGLSHGNRRYGELMARRIAAALT